MFIKEDVTTLLLEVWYKDTRIKKIAWAVILRDAKNNRLAKETKIKHKLELVNINEKNIYCSRLEKYEITQLLCSVLFSKSKQQSSLYWRQWQAIASYRFDC